MLERLDLGTLKLFDQKIDDLSHSRKLGRLIGLDGTTLRRVVVVSTNTLLVYLNNASIFEVKAGRGVVELNPEVLRDTEEVIQGTVWPPKFTANHGDFAIFPVGTGGGGSYVSFDFTSSSWGMLLTGWSGLFAGPALPVSSYPAVRARFQQPENIWVIERKGSVDQKWSSILEIDEDQGRPMLFPVWQDGEIKLSIILAQDFDVTGRYQRWLNFGSIDLSAGTMARSNKLSEPWLDFEYDFASRRFVWIVTTNDGTVEGFDPLFDWTEMKAVLGTRALENAELAFVDGTSGQALVQIWEQGELKGVYKLWSRQGNLEAEALCGT